MLNNYAELTESSVLLIPNRSGQISVGFYAIDATTSSAALESASVRGAFGSNDASLVIFSLSSSLLIMAAVGKAVVSTRQDCLTKKEKKEVVDFAKL
jgi:hypothetical protein